MAGVAGSQPSNLKKGGALQEQQADREEQIADNPFAKAFSGAESVQVETRPIQQQNVDELPTNPVPTTEGENPFARAFGTGSGIIDASMPGDVPLSEIDFTKEMDSPLQRMKYSYAMTDKERSNVLQNMFGKENVRKSGKRFYVKQADDNKFRPVDKDEFNFVNDVILDNARVGGEILAEFAGRFAAAKAGALLGATAGSVAPGVGTAAGAIAGGTVGFIAGGAAANVFATASNDAFAEWALDIDRDPERSRVTEYSVAGGLGALFGSIGAKFSKAAKLDKLQKAGQSTASKMSEAGQKLIKEKIQAIDSHAKVLNEVVQKKFGENSFTVLPHQYGGFVEGAMEEAKRLSTRPEFDDMLKGQQAVMESLYDDLISSFKVNGIDLGSNTVKDLAKATKMAEGKYIEKFRKAAIEAGGESKFEANFSVQGIENVLEKLGFVIKEEEGARLLVRGDTFDEIFLGASKSMKRDVSWKMVDLYEKIYNSGGMLTVRELDNIRGTVSILKNRSFTSADLQPLRGLMQDLYSNVSDDFLNISEKVLKNSPNTENYVSSMRRYSEIMSSSKKLKTLINQDDISRKGLTQAVFGSTKNLERIRAAKTLFSDEPRVWNGMVVELLEETKEKAIKNLSDGSTGLDFKTVKKELTTKLGDDGFKEVFGKGALFNEKTLKSYFEIGELVSASKFKSLPDTSKLGIMKRVALVLSNTFAGTKIDSMAVLLSRASSKDLDNFVNKVGMEKILSNVPSEMKEKIGSRLMYMIQNKGKTIYQGGRQFTGGASDFAPGGSVIEQAIKSGINENYILNSDDFDRK